MCLDPVSIGMGLGGLALNAAGQAVNGMEQNKSLNAQINARNAATNAELGRQNAYGATSRGAFNKTLGTFNPNAQATALAHNQANNTDFLNMNSPMDVGGIGSGHGPQGVDANGNNVVARVLSEGVARNAAQGNLTGYGSTMRDNAFALGDSGQAIDTVSNFARQSATVGAKEADAAYHNAARGPSGIGDLLNFGGTLLGYGAGKGFNPFGGPTGSVVTPRLVGTNGMVAGGV